MKFNYFEIKEKVKRFVVSNNFLFFYFTLVFIVIFLKLFFRDLCWFGLLNKEKCLLLRVPPRDGYYEVGLGVTYIFVLISFFIFFKMKKNKWQNTKSRLFAIFLFPLIVYIFKLPIRLELYGPVRDSVTKSAEIDCCTERLRINGNEVMFIDKNQPFCYYRRGEYLKGISCIFKFKY